ncbi:hypothetical protein [Streptomyces sp. ISL-100]|uniref:hypothetical protein n=1 Tax=Streptomyces sp. ISL-100 TaxID=2819173 RepID=UPI001BE5238E|nr:hypothetical protein [Streptomyces sp. ISL-100]MBT2394668.1 hypothetical protein [Streptomyces sp. ISL-100]
MPDTRCPRCGGPLGERPARSRLTADRDVFICTTCGTEEAVRQAHGQAPVPFGEWPLNT